MNEGGKPGKTLLKHSSGLTSIHSPGHHLLACAWLPPLLRAMARPRPNQQLGKQRAKWAWLHGAQLQHYTANAAAQDGPLLLVNCAVAGDNDGK